MKTEHPSPDDLALYVMDALALDAEPTAAIEAHVAACPSCAAALAREAKLEAAMYEVGASVDMTRSPQRERPAIDMARAPQRERPASDEPLARPKRSLRRAGLAAVAVACALAAGYLVWIVRPGHGAARAAERRAVVSCPPERGWAAASCQTRARSRGLYVEDPPHSAAVPVYEDFGRAGAPAPQR